MTTLLLRDAGNEVYLVFFVVVVAVFLARHSVALHKIRFLICKLEKESGHWAGTEEFCNTALLFWSLE